MKIKLVFFCLIMVFGCQESIKKVREFSEKGILKREGVLINNLKEGDWNTFDSQGDTSFIRTYISDSLIREVSFYQNKRISNIEFRNGKPNGLYQFYYESGEVECEGFNQNGNLIGIEKCYYKNGQIQRTTKMDDEGIEGEFFQYYSNGNIQLYAEKKGKGEHIHFDSLGNLGWRIIFLENKPIDTLEFNFSTF